MNVLVPGGLHVQTGQKPVGFDSPGLCTAFNSTFNYSEPIFYKQTGIKTKNVYILMVTYLSGANVRPQLYEVDTLG